MLEIVVPLYNEEENVDELQRRLCAACADCGEDWRITFVDDGSSDETPNQLRELAASEPRIQFIELSRNYGHQAAIRAGLEHSEGDAVVLLDGDLQDPPEVIPELFEAWKAGANIVVAQRRSRQETGLRRLGFDLFHRLFKYLADCRITPQSGTFSLMDRRVVEAVNALGERHRFFPGLRSLVGFREAIVQYDRQERLHGEPKQDFRRLFRYAADGVFSFSFKPLRLLTSAGLGLFLISTVVAAYFLTKRLLGLEPAPTGFTTLACGMFAMGGVQIAGMGLLGEYLGRIFEEVKQRPPYFVREFHRASAGELREDSSRTTKRAA